MRRIHTAVVLACFLALAFSAHAQQKPGRVTLAAIAVDPTSVIGGTGSTGRLTLTGPAPQGGLQIALTSSNSSAATVPDSVTVKTGMIMTTFTIATHPIGAQPNVVPPPVAVTITGTHSWGDPATRRVERTTQAATLTVLPPVVKNVGIASHVLCSVKGSQAGGTPLTGCVVLTGPAPSIKKPPSELPGLGGLGGAAVRLASNNPAIASVPGIVTVAAGQTRVNFAITTTPVAVDTPVVISAQRSQSDTHSASLTVEAPRLHDLTLSQASVQGGGSVEATIKLTGQVATGAEVVVDLRTTGGAGGAAVSVPASVSIRAGQDRGPAGIRTQPVTSPTTVTIGASYGGVTKTVTLTITPAPVAALASLTCNPSSAVGGTPSTCRVNLTTQAPSGGLAVALSSNSPTLVGVPANLTAPAGQQMATFPVTTTPVTNQTSVTISASYGGVTKTATLTLRPAALSQLLVGGLTSYSLPTPPPNSGTNVGGFVALDGPAPPGANIVLTFTGPATEGTNSAAVVALPQSITIQVGATNATFPFTLNKCLSYTTGPYCDGKLRATYKGVTKEVYVRVPSGG